MTPDPAEHVLKYAFNAYSCRAPGGLRRPVRGLRGVLPGKVVG